MVLKIITIILAVISIFATGCNEIGQTAGEGANGSNAIKEADLSKIDMDALNKDMDQMETSIAEVEIKLEKIDLAYLAAGSSSGGQNALDKELRALFTKLYSAIKNVYVKSGEVRNLIEAQLAQLDSSNPIHYNAIKKLQEYLKYLDDLQPKLVVLITQVTDKMTSLVVTIDGKIAKLEPNSPLTWAIQIVWLPVKNVLVEYRDKLIDLAT
jgi:hypothetical protein